MSSKPEHTMNKFSGKLSHVRENLPLDNLFAIRNEGRLVSNEKEFEKWFWPLMGSLGLIKIIVHVPQQNRFLTMVYIWYERNYIISLSVADCTILVGVTTAMVRNNFDHRCNHDLLCRLIGSESMLSAFAVEKVSAVHEITFNSQLIEGGLKKVFFGGKEKL